jgi:enamine deaminase RidA (YjgF/YER057c/UK114 family)
MAGSRRSTLVEVSALGPDMMIEIKCQARIGS